MLKTSMTGRWREEAVSCPFLGLLLGVSIAAHAHGAPLPATAQLISRVVALETNRVHYVTGGEGTNVRLFVHGWGGSTDRWREQVPAFADRARLIFVDLPGHGRSDQPMRDYSMDFFAQAILALLKDVPVPKATLIGHSMDGMLKPGQPAWDLQRVAVPVLVLNAPNPMWTPEYQAYVRSLSPRTDYRSLEGVGHFLMLEKPADFNRELLDMLRRFQLVDR